ncbi:FtsQ-type POTRA domain-containing protein [Brevundimonas sp. 2R-24]|uniref:Cell division protein FtsQ n=1 Tax=Peiella sedimenti TaxID=3061083 RepID=A0ABT8SN22_9CAUL|nr:FtsQ-type POTRA domain-containing protein [Caulobacteraceae bacterium XZ-24]
MPAVVRGGRRQGAAPRGQARAAQGSRTGRAAAPAPSRASLPQGVILGGAAAAALVLGVALFSGERGAVIGESLRGWADGRMAALGFKLRRINIQGATPEAQLEIQRVLNLRSGQPLALMDLDTVRTQVEQVGWVKDVRVVRLLPDTLVIAVTQRTAAAVWQTGGVVQVIDAAGEPIPGADPGRFAQLPLVVGEGAADAAPALLPMIRSRPRLAARLDALVRVDNRRWDLRLKDGALIQLPAVDEEGALIRLDALDQRQRLLDLGFSRIDLRLPEAVAVRLAG